MSKNVVFLTAILMALSVSIFAQSSLESEMRLTFPEVENLEIETVRSFTIIRGTAPNASTRERLERAVAERTPLKVLNVLSVAVRVSDPEIARAVERALHLNQNLESARISVRTQEGIVILTGEVDGLLEYEAAADTASTIEGVIEVVNRLQIVS